MYEGEIYLLKFPDSIREKNNIIDNTPYMKNIRKEFFKKSIKYRKEKILDKFNVD